MRRQPANVPVLLLVCTLVGLATGVGNSPSTSRWFDTPDDWIHLDRAQQMAQNGPSEWGTLLFDDGYAGVRPLPHLLWLLDFFVWGWEAGGYFATNIGLLSILAALVCWMVGRHTGAPLAGAVAGSAVGLSVGANEPAYLLAARDDLLATVFAVLAVLAWQRREGLSGATAAGVCLCLSLLSKPVAVLLPFLFILERHRKGTAGPLQGWLEVGVASLGVVPAMAIWGAQETSAGTVGLVWGGHWRPWDAIVMGIEPHLLPSFSRSRHPLALLHDLPRLCIFGLLLFASRRGLGKSTLCRAGLVLFLSGLLVHLPFLGADTGLGAMGRYLVLSGVGLALWVGHAVAARPEGIRNRDGALALTAILFGFALGAMPQLSEPVSPARAVWKALDELEIGSDQKVFVALSRPDRGALSLLTSPLLARHLGYSPEVFVQGSPRTLVAGRRRGELHFSHRALARPAVSPRDIVLRDETAVDGSLVFVRSQLESSGGLGDMTIPFDDSWTFHGDPRGPLDQDPPRMGSGEIAELRTWSHLPGLDVWRSLERAPRAPVHLARRLNGLDPTAFCELRLEASVLELTHQNGAGAGPAPFQRFMTLFYSEEASPSNPSENVVLIPYSATSGRQVARVDLSISPSWQSTPRIEWIGLMAANSPADLALHSLQLVGCDGRTDAGE